MELFLSASRQDVVEWEVQQVENLGVEIKTNTRVGVDVSVDEHTRQL